MSSSTTNLLQSLQALNSTLRSLDHTVDVYDPETNWSIVSATEQHLLRTIVQTAPELSLSIGYVLKRSRLPETSPRIQWVKHLVAKRLARG